MNKFYKKKCFQIISFIILNIIYLIVTVFFYLAIGGTRIKAEMTVKFDNDTHFAMFYTNNSKSIYNNEMVSKIGAMEVNEFTKISFVLDTKDILGLKIHFGHKQNTVQIKELLLRNPFKQVVFKPEDILNVFNNVAKDIGEIKIEDKVLKIVPKGEDPYIYTDKIGNILSKASYNYKVISTLIIMSIIMTLITFKCYYCLKRRGICPKKVVFILVFILILCMPNIGIILGIKDKGSTEKRGSSQLQGFEGGALERLIRTTEAKYDDNFGFRNLLIRLNALIDTKVFNTTPTEKVILGKEDWLFYKFENNKDLSDDYRGVVKFTEEELERMKVNLEEKRNWLRRKNVPFVLMITPNKSSIYGEYYSDKYKKVSDDTRLDQFLEYMKKNSDVEIVDVRSTLINKKSEERLYHKTDTHWNEYGAYYGYRDLMNTLSKYIPELVPLGIEQFEVVKEFRKPAGSDLANMIGLPERYGEEYILLKPKIERKCTPIENEYYDLLRGDILENVDKSKPKLLMYRDSFAVPLVPYISEHFSESVYEWSYNFNGILVDQVNPDIVVQEIVERSLEKLLMENTNYIK